MISVQEAILLKKLIEEVRSADELLGRAQQGYSNKTPEQAQALLKVAQKDLKTFITSITEKKANDA